MAAFDSLTGFIASAVSIPGISLIDATVIHDSMAVAPQFGVISPMGIFNTLFRYLPNMYPTALKSPTLDGDDFNHCPLQSSCGVSAGVGGIVNILIMGYWFASKTSSIPPSTRWPKKP